MHQNGNVSFAYLLAVVFLTTATLPNSRDFLPYKVIALSNEKKLSASRNKISREQPPKGFGRTDALDDLLRTYPTRRPDHTDNNQPCPCGVGAMSYGDCCYPYHAKMKLPETPKRVLQSRYSAFVYRLIGYIIDTTHPSCRDYRNNKVSWANDLHRKGMFDSVDFVSLNITKCDESGYITNLKSEDYIDFQVTLRAKVPPGQESSALSSSSTDESLPEVKIQERSKFILNNTTRGWLYASGVVRSTAIGIEEIVLNH